MAGLKAVVIAVDGLRASALGAYGNTWHPTPELDALASRSVVVDWMLCESPELADFYHATWVGRVEASAPAAALPAALANIGGAATLITDDQPVAAWGEAAGFGEVVCLESESAVSADEVSETALAGLLAVAAGYLPAGDAPALFWIHARGYRAKWDAPLELRAGLLDDDDPEPAAFVDPPIADATTDHDRLLGYRAAYAAQTIVLDECLGGLLAAVADAGIDEQTMVVLVGCSGFALGEHGVAGAAEGRLYGERLHVPCLIRPPQVGSARESAPPRWSALATPCDLHATLLEWFGAAGTVATPDAVNLLAHESTPRDFLLARGHDGDIVLRTAGWMLRLNAPVGGEDHGERVDGKGAADGVELYVKPDDRWEANEIADRCPHEVERLLAILAQARAGG